MPARLSSQAHADQSLSWLTTLSLLGLTVGLLKSSHTLKRPQFYSSTPSLRMPKAGQRPLGLLRIILCKARPRSMTMPRWTGMGTFGLADLIDSQAPKSSQEFPRVPKSSQEFPRVPVQVCSEYPRCSRGPRCSYEHTFQPWAAITSEKTTTQVQLNGFSGSIIFSYFAS